MSFVSDLFGGDQPDYSAAEFRPYSVTTPFGSSNVEGQNITATLTPELKALYDKYLFGATSALPSSEQLAFGKTLSEAGQGLFGDYLGNLKSALNYDVSKATSDYYNQQQDILASGRAKEDVQTADILFKTGRTGAGVGVTGGYVNPELFSLLKAREEANASMLLNAEDRARAIRASKIEEATGGINTALGLFGTGTNLPTTLYGASQGVLTGAMGIPSNLGTQIGYGLQAGSAAATAGANIANMQQQQYQSNLGFWGGLLGGAAQGVGKGGGGWSSLFKW
jgi:hypothetical protein